MSVITGRIAAGAHRRQLASLTLYFLLVAGFLYWAKWGPYWQKLPAVAGSHSLGVSLLAVTPAPSLMAGFAYSVTYFRAIWPALVAGMIVAAGIETLVPPDWLLKVTASGGQLRRSLLGGALAVPSLMCTCCAAPPAVAMRRMGVPTTTALAYWVGNPALNPVVIAFAAFVLPWPLVALRALSGLALVVIAIPLIGRLAGRDPSSPALVALPEAAVDPTRTSAPQVARRFATAFGRLALTLLPEYALIVFALGAFRGLLVSAVQLAGIAEPLAVAVLALAGTLFAIPTAAEIPIVQGIARTGLGMGPAAALLVTLPAVSLPSILMVWRSFPRRVTLAVAGAVALIGILDGLVALLLFR